MKYHHTKHTNATLEWTMAQALEGETVEAQLHQLRAEFEPPIAAAHEKVKAETRLPTPNNFVRKCRRSIRNLMYPSFL